MSVQHQSQHQQQQQQQQQQQSQQQQQQQQTGQQTSQQTSSQHGQQQSSQTQPRVTTKSIGNYILGRTIGEGTFGKVKLGRHILSGANVAIKVLQKDRIVEIADVERVAREVHILKLIRHPHIVQLFEIIETRGQLYLIMEFASGGELFDHIVERGRVAEPEACRFFHQIIAGVEKIHEMRVVHRDLKPENLLLDEHKCIKIVDFGLSNLFRDGQRLSTACGSPCYAPPEMVAGQQYVPQMCDLWSCGVILFALVCGYLPFEDQNTGVLYKKILAADYSLPNSISDAVKDLIAGLLTVDPQKRFTIASVRSHPWYRQLSESSVPAKEGSANLDEEVLQELEAYGFPRDYAVRCLELNKHNHITTTYYLLLERKNRVLDQLNVGPNSPQGVDTCVKAWPSTNSRNQASGNDPDEMSGRPTQESSSPTPVHSGAGPGPSPTPTAVESQTQSCGSRTPRVGGHPGVGSARDSSTTPRVDHPRNSQQARRSPVAPRQNASPTPREQYSARNRPDGISQPPSGSGSERERGGGGPAGPGGGTGGAATTPRTTSPWRAQHSATPPPYSTRGSARGSGVSEAYGNAIAALGTAQPGMRWPRAQSTTPQPYSARGKSPGVHGHDPTTVSSVTPPPGGVGSWRHGATTPHSARASAGGGAGGVPGAHRNSGGSQTPDVAGTGHWRERHSGGAAQATPRTGATPRTAFTPRPAGPGAGAGAGAGTGVTPRSTTPQATGAYRTSETRTSAAVPSGGMPSVGGRTSVMSARRRPPSSALGASAEVPAVRGSVTPVSRMIWR